MTSNSKHPGKIFLNLSTAAVLALPLTFGLIQAPRLYAQTAPANPKDIADTWQGTLHGERDLRLVVKITKDDKGGYKAAFSSIDQGPGSMPVTKITLDGSDVKMTLEQIDGVYTGKLSPDGKTMDGTWTQGGPKPLILTRATPETAWAIPVPPPRLPPMPADAHPVFEVATIKPSKPDAPGKMFRVQGRKFNTLNTTLSEIISFAYGVHAKQVVGAPAWVETDKFDLEAVPDLEGTPSDRQLKEMTQKLLTDRFKLTFHKDKKELSVYVLAVAKTGPKLEQNTENPDGLPGLWFRGLGVLNVTNATMKDFAGLMQSAVLDRPVVDQTGLTGRWNFRLRWTPDDSQFGGMGAKIPPPTDAANAPPALYTAIQEQIGLKLDPTKAPTDVMVVDHVEKPTDN
ncbi:TIGR03435 family protein [Granulicella sibirica]|uniref:CHP03435 domain-containing protein n=1 Tax=Granulicella sibirica TaxID=2479048 RepID=A0A4Q0TB60_9BACT|nr:TIGR03435 family protein [Granulicella sibirica]RXH58891.1 CHP03435 domain-containing protein [Granulicella sibirica]